MKVACAWCGKYLGKKEPLENKRVTHTICKKCGEKELKKAIEINPNHKEMQNALKETEKILEKE